MSKHTPGPWVKKSGFLVGANGQPVRVSGTGIALAMEANPDEETRANSHLLFAAPAMLEALRHLLRIHENARHPKQSSNTTFVDTRDFEAACADARAAIAAAEGREP